MDDVNQTKTCKIEYCRDRKITENILHRRIIY